MFETKLPYELELYIYKIYFSINVLTKIKSRGYTVFENMSQNLIKLIITSVGSHQVSNSLSVENFEDQWKYLKK